MGLQIESGRGDGNTAAVSVHNELLTHSVSVSEEHSVNMDHGEAYSWRFSNDALANDDCIFYMKNTNGKNLVLEGITIYVSGACEISFAIKNIGTTAPGSVVTAVNLNTNSGKNANCIAIHGEDLQAGGTLNTGSRTECLHYIGATNSSHYNFPCDLMITAQQSFTVWCNTAGIIVSATLYGYFANPVH